MWSGWYQYADWITSLICLLYAVPHSFPTGTQPGWRTASISATGRTGRKDLTLRLDCAKKLGMQGFIHSGFQPPTHRSSCARPPTVTGKELHWLLSSVPCVSYMSPTHSQSQQTSRDLSKGSTRATRKADIYHWKKPQCLNHFKIYNWTESIYYSD